MTKDSALISSSPAFAKQQVRHTYIPSSTEDVFKHGSTHHLSHNILSILVVNFHWLLKRMTVLQNQLSEYAQQNVTVSHNVSILQRNT
jgi:hypothetical protein